MARSKYSRKMARPPHILGMKPFGQQIKHDQMIQLLYEEYEAIRLCDYQALSQEEAAAQMQISRPTLTRILERGRKKMAQALVEGHALVLRGGHVFFEEQWYRCEDCDTLYAWDQDAEQSNDPVIVHDESKIQENKNKSARYAKARGRNCNCPHCHSGRRIHLNKEAGGGIMRHQGQHARQGYQENHNEHHEHNDQKNIGNQGMGPVGNCVCLHCGHKAAHEPGVPCKDSRCSECGKKMVREGSYHHEQYLSRQ